MDQDKKTSEGSLLQLKIILDGIEPEIWRRVVVPDTITLPKLHQTIQEAMGWSNMHIHEFEFGGKRYGEPDPDWDLAFNSVESEKRVKLKTCITDLDEFSYLYDFGDNWEHNIKIEKRLPPDLSVKSPLCLGGSGACPPEDVGGIYGYVDFIETMEDPDHPEHKNFIEWFGIEDFDAEHFDLVDTNVRLTRIKV